MTIRTPAGNARDRLLQAAAELMDRVGDRDVSTRAVCELAGVTAPTLYHHFGSMQGLIDAVINHGFTQYVQPPDTPGSANPVDDIRRGWDQHVRFGLDHPTFYALLYGRARPGTPCAITAPAHAMLRDLLSRTAEQGMLTVPADAAAEQIMAANVGVTLTLISQPTGQRDMALSERVREAALAGVLTPTNAPHAPATPTTRAAAALTLKALIEDNTTGLTPGEHTLLGELLDRLATA